MSEKIMYPLKMLISGSNIDYPIVGYNYVAIESKAIALHHLVSSLDIKSTGPGISLSSFLK